MPRGKSAVPIETFQTFGALLRFLRRRARLTQKDLAVAVDYSEAQISRLELNQRTPNLSTLVALFVPALDIEDEPEVVARLAELAADARGSDAEEALAGKSVSLMRTTVHSASDAVSVDTPGRNGEAPASSKVAQQQPYPANVPIPATPLIGRDHELATLQRLLARNDMRLVTLLGGPGIGKSRLSLELAAAIASSFADGVHWVSLATVTEPREVAAAIAEVLQVAEQGGEAPQLNLVKALRDKQCLIVLDNFEQVLAAAPLVTDMLMAARRLKIVVTSRAPLRVSGEQEWPVQPLALPDVRALPTLDELRQCAAINLFITRARAVDPSFTLTSFNALAVATICVRLDGLPLAIELAAARSKVLDPQALLARLHGRLHLLTRGARDLPPRHQTLAGAIAWSYDLLKPSEQALFASIAVFVGGCSIEAIEAVCGLVFDDLQTLSDSSLLQVEHLGESTFDERRFSMLETIREYALERLIERNELAAVQRRHAAFYRQLAEQAELGLTGPTQKTWHARLEREHENLRAALRWTRDSDELELGLQLSAALWRFWFAKGYLAEGQRWLEDLLARAKNAGTELNAARAKALYGAGVLAGEQGDFKRAEELAMESLQTHQLSGDKAGIAGALTVLGNVQLRHAAYDRATATFEQSLALRQELGDPRGISVALNNLGRAARETGDAARAAGLYEQSLALKRVGGDKRSIAIALNNLGDVMLDLGELTRAKPLFQESLGLLEEIGEQWGVAFVLINLGHVALQCGEHAEAVSKYADSLRLYQQSGAKPEVSECLEGLAGATAALGDPRRAALLFGGAAALRLKLDTPIPFFARARLDQNVSATRNALGDAAFTTAWTVGESMPLEQIVTYALGDEP